MKLMGGKPNSRQGKKQVISYVTPELADRVRAKAEREDKTKQEIVAMAINSFFEAHDREPVFTVGHQRLVKRRKGAAKPRTRANAPDCRAGKQPIGGWFDTGAVQEVRNFSREIGISVQDMLETGLAHVTGYKPMPIED